MRPCFRSNVIVLLLVLLGAASSSGLAGPAHAAPPTTPWLVLDGVELEVGDTVLVRTDAKGRVLDHEVNVRLREGRPGVRLPVCEEGAAVVVQTSRAVSPPLRLALGECRHDELRTALLPAARVEARVRPPRGERAPEGASLWLQACPGRGGGEATRAGVPVRVAENGAWSASVPAGCRGLRLFSRRYAPVTWQRPGLEAGRVTTLATRDLAPAGFLLAEPTCELDRYSFSGARVDLVHTVELDRARAAGATPAPLYTAFADADGRIVFPGLPEGSFVLDVGAASGLPSTTKPFRIVSGEQSVQPIHCRVPAHLDVRFTVLDPGVADPRLWKLRARPLGDGQQGVERETVPAPDFTASLADLAPGDWHLSAQAQDGGGVAYADGYVELGPGERRELELRVESGLFEGSLIRRGEPLAAELRLRSETARPGEVEAVTSSDGEGRFTVRLPRAGRYSVQIQAGPELPFLVVPNVLFESPGETVEIAVPETRLAGRVVGPDGSPVRDAVVVAAPLDEASSHHSVPSHARTGEGGEFELEGLPPGEWRISARWESFYSGLRKVRLEEGAGTEVALRLAEGRSVSGRVVTLFGEPIFPAEAQASTTDREADGDLYGRRFRTTPEGRFRVHFPATSSPWWNVQVEAGVTPLTALRVAAETPVELALPLYGGRVELRGQGDGWRHRELHRLALVRDGGGVVQPLRSRTVRVDGSLQAPTPRWRMVLPDLAPGTWRLVYLTRDLWPRILRSPRATPPALATFHLGVGESLEVEAAPPS